MMEYSWDAPKSAALVPRGDFTRLEVGTPRLIQRIPKTPGSRRRNDGNDALLELFEALMGEVVPGGTGTAKMHPLLLAKAPGILAPGIPAPGGNATVGNGGAVKDLLLQIHGTWRFFGF